MKQATYSTYKHYLLANKLQDSRENYAAYVDLQPITRGMSEAMKRQHIERTWLFRFTPHAYDTK